MTMIAPMRMAGTQDKNLRALAGAGDDAPGVSAREVKHLWQIFC
jgi:hypothetical protein